MANLPSSDSLQRVTDEELILRRNGILNESENPKLSFWQKAGMYLPSLAVGGVTFFGMDKLGKHLKESNKLTSGIAKFGFGAGKFVVAGVAALAGFTYFLSRTIRARASEMGEQFEGVNTEIGRRIGKSAEEVGLEPITAADMQRMKEAHQSGAAIGQHTERTAQVAAQSSFQQAM